MDCISNLTDNTVVGVLPAILEKTNEAGIPVYGSEVEQMKLGCVAGAVCFWQLLSILENESTCSDARWARVARRFLIDKARRHLQ